MLGGAVHNKKSVDNGCIDRDKGMPHCESRAAYKTVHVHNNENKEHASYAY